MLKENVAASSPTTLKSVNDTYGKETTFVGATDPPVNCSSAMFMQHRKALLIISSKIPQPTDLLKTFVDQYAKSSTRPQAPSFKQSTTTPMATLSLTQTQASSHLVMPQA
jgi:hypothetical protein